jgi:hypothetical protein
MTQKLKCAWLSRHDPTAEQRTSLADFEIVQVDRTFRNGKEAWVAANEGGEADIIMAVLPIPMLAELLRLAGSTPIIRAYMVWPRDRVGEPRWSGKWSRVKQVVVERDDWSPYVFSDRQRGNGRMRLLS